MSKTPIFDVALGLIFVFPIYSLLATSVKEVFAGILALRARMLKKGITIGMLSDTQKKNTWASLAAGLAGFVEELTFQSSSSEA